MKRVQRQIERFAELPDAPVNFYDLREIINRYIGLTLAVGDEAAANFGGGRQLLKSPMSRMPKSALFVCSGATAAAFISSNSNSRRFSKAIFQLMKSVKNPELLLNLSVKLTNLLNDEKTPSTNNRFFQSKFAKHPALKRR